MRVPSIEPRPVEAEVVDAAPPLWIQWAYVLRWPLTVLAVLLWGLCVWPTPYTYQSVTMYRQTRVYRVTRMTGATKLILDTHVNTQPASWQP